MALYGDLISNCTQSPMPDSFLIRNSTTALAWINSSNCNLCVLKTVKDSFNIGTGDQAGTSYYIRNSTGTNLMAVQDDGDVAFLGPGCYNYSGTAVEIT